MTQAVASAQRASASPAMAGLARFGLAARAFVYLVIGWLALQIAFGHHTHEANQRGAFAEVARHPLGVALLWVLAVGFAAYALWRLSEAAFGTAVAGPKVAARLKALGQGIFYGVLAVSTVAFIVGRDRKGQAQQQETWTARVMRHDLGRWLVGLAGVIVLVVGVVMVVDGARKKFLDELRTEDMKPPARTVVTGLGVVGTAARGIVFAIAGGLVIDAAVTFDARKSTGLDGALHTLADRAYGPWLLGALAVGLITFGIYGFAAARWVKTA